MLLTDVQSISYIQVIEEASANNNHRPKVRGLFQRADEANQNKRIYPRAILENQVKKLQPLIKERRLCGELDHPQNDTVKLTNASHLVTKLWMEGAEVFGEAEILNTPNGKVAQALINDGVKIGISSRGLGTLSEDHITGQKTVNEDYNLVTFDLVADPSTRGAYPSLSESRILEEAKYEKTLKEAVSERVFLTVLKNALLEGKHAGGGPGRSGVGGDWWEDPADARVKMFGAGNDPYGAPNDPNRSEPKNWAAARRANYAASQQALTPRTDKPKKRGKPSILAALKRLFGKRKGKGKGTNDGVEYIHTRSMERLAENKLRDRVREIVEDAKKGYPKKGIKGGTKAARREARRRGY